MTAHRVGLAPMESDELMNVALDFDRSFSQYELVYRSGFHPATVGNWLVRNVANGNLIRNRVNGALHYRWSD